MPDKTQINLERIRACDAEWEESKHPRSENGQFTSGGGVKVSKIQSGGKAKVQTQEQAESAAYERYGAKADRISREKNKIDNEKEAAHKKYRNARHRLYNLAIKANRAGQKSKAEKYDDLADKVEERREEVLASYDPKIEGLVKKRQNAKETRKRELQNIAKTFNAAKATLEKARPKIAAMRLLAKSAGGDFYTAKNKLLNNPRISQEVKNAVKKMKAPAGAKPQSIDGLVQHYIDKGDNDRASIAIQLRMEMMDGHDFRGAVHNLLSKYDEAEDKGWMDRESYDKNVDMLLNDVSGAAWDVLNPPKPKAAPAPAAKPMKK